MPPVQTIRRFLRQACALALVAMLALALAPSVSHALASIGGFDPAGAVGSASTATSGDPAGTAAMHMQHCPLCSLTGTTPVLPRAATPELPVAAGKALVPACFLYAGARTQHAWATAQPRAPPHSR